MQFVSSVVFCVWVFAAVAVVGEAEFPDDNDAVLCARVSFGGPRLPPGGGHPIPGAEVGEASIPKHHGSVSIWSLTASRCGAAITKSWEGGASIPRHHGKAPIWAFAQENVPEVEFRGRLPRLLKMTAFVISPNI